MQSVIWLTEYMQSIIWLVVYMQSILRLIVYMQSLIWLIVSMKSIILLIVHMQSIIWLIVNPTAFKKAKTLWSFGCSECNRVNMQKSFLMLTQIFDTLETLLTFSKTGLRQNVKCTKDSVSPHSQSQSSW